MSGSGADGGDASSPQPLAVEPPPKQEVALREEIEGALEEYVAPEKRQVAAARVESVVVASEFYRGALPHPRHFREFNEILPGAAERILSMTEKEQSFRHTWHNTIVKTSGDYGTRGQWIGAALMLVPIAAAAFFAYHGNNIAAALFLAPPVIAGAIAFVRGQINLFGSDDDDDEEEEN